MRNPFKRKTRQKMTTVTEDDTFKYGDKVKWLGSPGTIEGKAGPSRWLVWTGIYLVEVWESELTKM